MPSELVVGAFTLGGVAVGAGLTYLTDRRMWRRSQALSGRLLLAETFRSIWSVDAWGEMQVQLRRVRAYLEALGAEEAIFLELEEAIYACRRSIARQVEEHSFDPDEGPGLSMELVARYEAAEKAVIEHLR